MALYARLIGTEEPKIGVHQFMAAISELIRGEATRAEIISMFGLRLEDETDLDLLINKGAALNAGDRFEFARVIHDTLLLAEEGLKYTTEADFRARINREPKRAS